MTASDGIQKTEIKVIKHAMGFLRVITNGHDDTNNDLVMNYSTAFEDLQNVLVFDQLIKSVSKLDEQLVITAETYIIKQMPNASLVTLRQVLKKFGNEAD